MKIQTNRTTNHSMYCRFKGEYKVYRSKPKVWRRRTIIFEAGVAYAEILRKMVKGEEIQPIIGEFKELTMLRYDEAVFI